MEEEILQNERARILSEIDRLEIYNLEQDGDFGEQYEEVRDELLERIRRIVSPSKEE